MSHLRISSHPKLRVESLERRLLLTGDLNLSIASNRFSELLGTAATTFDIVRTGDTSLPLTVAITTNRPDEVSVPATATINAGASSVQVSLDIINDPTVDGDQDATITAQAATYSDGQSTVTILDDDTLSRMTIGGYYSGSLPDDAYVVTSDWTILRSSHVTIDPGTEFSFDAGKQLIVEGRLTAVGTTDQPVLFTSGSASPTPGDWGGLYFFSKDELTSSLQYVEISFGQRGIYVNDPSRTTSPLRVDNSHIHHSEHEGVLLSANRHIGSNVSIVRNIIEHNNVGITMGSSSSGCNGASNTAFVGNNIIRHNTTSAIVMSASGSSGFYCIPSRSASTRGVIDGNYIHSNGEGIVVRNQDRPGGNGANVSGQIHNNVIEGNTTYGLRFDLSDTAGVGTIVANNTILDHSLAGIYHPGRGGFKIRNNIVAFNGNGFQSTAAWVPGTRVSFNNVFGNTTDDWVNYPSEFGQPTQSNSQGVPSDIYSNISIDPEFEPGTLFRLGGSSPMKDSGTTGDAPVTDFDGEPRLLPDIGADELQEFTVSLSRTSVRESPFPESILVTLSRNPAVAVRTVNVQLETQFPELRMQNVGLVWSAGTTQLFFSISVDDNPVVEETRSLSFTAIVSGYNTQEASIVVLDDDEAGIDFVGQSGGLQLNEGTSVSYDLTLTSQPTSSVTLSLATDLPLTLDLSELVFNPQQWNIPQTVVVTLPDDFYAESDFLSSVRHSVASIDTHYLSLSEIAIDIQVFDDDTASVSFEPVSTPFEVWEGSRSAEYQVRLTSKPLALVEIDLSGPLLFQLTAQSLSFPPDLWDVPQLVSIDSIADNELNGERLEQITHSISSFDQSYAGLAPTILEVATVELLQIVKSAAVPIVVESGSNFTYNLALTRKPDDDVSLKLTSVPGVSFSQQEITFEHTNWRIPHSLTISVVEDEVAESNRLVSIEHVLSSNDVYFQRITESFDVMRVDDDVAELRATVLGTALSETGSTTELNIKLSSQPLSDVLVTLTTDSQSSVTTESLTFTTDNWNIHQPVTIAAVDDLRYELVHETEIYLAASGQDQGYSGLTQTETISIMDNDFPPHVEIVRFGNNELGRIDIQYAVEHSELLSLTIDLFKSGDAYFDGSDRRATETITIVEDSMLEPGKHSFALSDSLLEDVIGNADNQFVIAVIGGVGFAAGSETEQPSLYLTGVILTDAGTLVVRGSEESLAEPSSRSGEDRIRIREEAGIITVTLNDNGTTYDEALIADVVVYGYGGSDDIRANSGIDSPMLIVGGAGNNIVVGGSGGDTIIGGNGRDTMNGNGGNDLLIGMGGRDRIFGSGGDDTLQGGMGNDRLVGLGGRDLIRGELGDDALLGRDGNDTVEGGDGDDFLNGGRHDDSLDGGIGNDRLFGVGGNDLLIGGHGADLLRGGHGNDIMNGTYGAVRDFLIDFILGESGNDILEGLFDSRDRVKWNQLEEDNRIR